MLENRSAILPYYLFGDVPKILYYGDIVFSKIKNKWKDPIPRLTLEGVSECPRLRLAYKKLGKERYKKLKLPFVNNNVLGIFEESVLFENPSNLQFALKLQTQGMYIAAYIAEPES